MTTGPRRVLQIGLLLTVAILMVPVVIGLREDAIDAPVWLILLIAAAVVGLGFVFDALGKRRP